MCVVIYIVFDMKVFLNENVIYLNVSLENTCKIRSFKYMNKFCELRRDFCITSIRFFVFMKRLMRILCIINHILYSQIYSQFSFHTVWIRDGGGT